MKPPWVMYRAGSARTAAIALAVLLLSVWPVAVRPQRDFLLECEIRWQLFLVFAGSFSRLAISILTSAPKSYAVPE